MLIMLTADAPPAEANSRSSGGTPRVPWVNIVKHPCFLHPHQHRFLIRRMHTR
jgi:hypothetical protein